MIFCDVCDAIIKQTKFQDRVIYYCPDCKNRIIERKNGTIIHEKLNYKEFTNLCTSCGINRIHNWEKEFESIWVNKDLLYLKYEISQKKLCKPCGYSILNIKEANFMSSDEGEKSSSGQQIEQLMKLKCLNCRNEFESNEYSKFCSFECRENYY